jgi:hypothetical protein
VLSIQKECQKSLGCALYIRCTLSAEKYGNKFLFPLSLVDKNLSDDLLYGDELYFPQFGNSIFKDWCGKQQLHVYT